MCDWEQSTVRVALLAIAMSAGVSTRHAPSSGATTEPDDAYDYSRSMRMTWGGSEMSPSPAIFSRAERIAASVAA